MAKEASVAPKERVNIVYKPAIGDAQEEVELPLKILMMGDYTLREDERELEDRKPISIDKDNFNDVLKGMDLNLLLSVKDRLSGKEENEIPVELKIASLKDLGPEAITRQVPELNRLLELRSALQALKGPLGNIPAFRKKIEGLMGDKAARDRLLAEVQGD